MEDLFIFWLLSNLLIIVNCENCQDGGLETCLNEETSPIIKWPSQCYPSEELIVSYQHRCLDTYKHYVTRKCTPTGWVPELIDIQCPESIDEYTIRTPCPPGFKTLAGVLDDIRICVQIFPAQSWENKCLKSGSSLVLEDLDLSLTEKVLEQVRIDIGDNFRFWLPARQLWYSNLEEIEKITGSVNYSVQWTLAGIYGQNVMPTTHSGNGCLLTDYSVLTPTGGPTNIVTDCDESYPIICLYDQKEPTMLQLSCQEGYKTTRYEGYQDVCIKIRKLSNELSDEYLDLLSDDIFYIDSGYALHIFKEMSLSEQLTESDRCLFGIVPGRVIITEEEWTLLNMDSIPFINWSFNVSMSSIDSEEFVKNILVVKNNGEWVWEDSSAVTCAISFIPNDVYHTNPDFSYLNDRRNFFVSVTNETTLWKEHEFQSGLSCFSYTYISKQIESVHLTPSGTEEAYETLVRTRYRLSPNGSGKYWCTGYLVKSFELVGNEIMWNDPSKFAILAKNRNLPSGTSIDNQFYYFLESNLDMNIFRIHELGWEKPLDDDVHLFHVIISVITDDFLKFEENLINLNDHMLAAYYIKQNLKNITSLHPEFLIISVNSTEFCLPTTLSNSSEINWQGSRIGRFATSNEFCLLHTNGLPATKRCLGDSLFGATWVESFDEIICNNDIKSNATKDLHELKKINISPERVIKTITQLDEIVGQSNYTVLIAADIFYVSQIMQEITLLAYPLDHDNVNDILGIYNRLLMVGDSAFSSASTLNSTNDLLYAADVILTNFAIDNKQTHKGILSFEFSQPMLSTFIFDSNVTDFTGIIVTNQTNHLNVEFINKSRSAGEIMNVTNLIIASYIPETLITILKNPPIVMSLFINDVLFHPFNPDNVVLPKQYVDASGSIISIILPGSYKNLPQAIPIFIKPDLKNEIDRGDNACGFWDFSDFIDGWATKGCFRNKTLVSPTTTVLCECEHVTHFAYLFYGNRPIDMRHFEKLQTITYIACSVSLVGFSGIYLSAILFRSFRSTLSTKFLLQISAAITLEMLMILFVNTEANTWILIATDKTFVCIVFGAVLHYTVLVTFFWMLIIAYVQFKRYVIVFHTLESNNFFLISSVVGWGVSTIPVVLVLLIDRQSYVPTLGYYKICYPSGYALYISLMAPVAVITIANSLIFMLIVKSLKSDNRIARKHQHESNILSKSRLSIFLFFLFGLTCIFAFLSAIDVAEVGIVFTYLFCAAATLQGFILFIYFIMLDPVVRRLWIK